MRTLIPTLVLFMFVLNSYGQIERDKALHFLGGNLFGLVGAGIAKQASDGNRTWTFIGSVAGSALIGVAKEAVDSGQRENGWDNDDLAATVLGGITVGVSIEIFSKKRNKRRPMGSLTTQRFNRDIFKIDMEANKAFVISTELPNFNSLGFSSLLSE
ncbi:hypothetical protein [Flagellimonas pacifica]|uniref:Uncharacterized protein n=1 Tax=Flagellimonas pacifica TaxID=1247520 RepID=A0A285MV99_9FLAO|nr:hypothetical protein [Allomuricauda parva]SNY99401.1 hypothetical protein SAMN06265377_1206 [Allomuricauda parva]